MKSKILLAAASAIVLFSIMGAYAIYKIGDVIIDKALEAEISNIDELYLNVKKEVPVETETSTEKPTEKPTAETVKPDTKGNASKDAETVKQIYPGKKSTVESETRKNAKKTEGGQESTPENEIRVKVDSEVNGNGDRITPDKIKQIKDRVSAADKMKAGTLVLKRLNPSDIDELIKMLENGITKEELERAKKLVYERFTADEVAEIKKIYRKYMYG